MRAAVLLVAVLQLSFAARVVAQQAPSESAAPEIDGVAALTADQQLASESSGELQTPLSSSFAPSCWLPPTDGGPLDLMGADEGSQRDARIFGHFLPLGACGYNAGVSLHLAGVIGELGVVAPALTVESVLLRRDRLFLSASLHGSGPVAPGGGSYNVPPEALGAYAIVLRLGATSATGRWNLWLEGLFLPPSGSSGSSSQWSLALVTLMSISPYDGGLYLPRAQGRLGGAVGVGFRVRTADRGYHAILGAGLRLGEVAGASPTDNAVGFLGALRLEAYMAHAGLWREGAVSDTWRIGVRVDGDLSSFWPANSVLPLHLRMAVGWLPTRQWSAELWVGTGFLLLNERSDTPRSHASVGGSVELRF